MSTGDRKLFGVSAGSGMARADHSHANIGFAEKETAFDEPATVAQDGERTTELLQRPTTAAELIDALPDEGVLRTENKMRKGKEVNGHPVLPLPSSLSWISGAKVDSDVTYTFIREIVHQEVRLFAERLDRYFVLVPKDNDGK